MELKHSIESTSDCCYPDGHRQCHLSLCSTHVALPKQGLDKHASDEHSVTSYPLTASLKMFLVLLSI